MYTVKPLYFHRIETILKVIFCLILAFNTISADPLKEYESTKYQGKNKYQRIGEIEAYLTKLSQELPKQIETNLSPLQKKIETLESKIDPSKGESSKIIEDLKREISLVKEELEKKIDSDIIVIVKKIEDEKKANEAALDALRGNLETKILAIEKILSGFGKVQTLKSN